MPMPGRNWDISSYRYGYQGSEMDNEVKGEGNHYTTEFRQLDPRLGRWFSVDPLAAQFPWQSPYMSMDGNPVSLTDILGDKTNYYNEDGTIKETKNDNWFHNTLFGTVHKVPTVLSKSTDVPDKYQWSEIDEEEFNKWKKEGFGLYYDEEKIEEFFDLYSVINDQWVDYDEAGNVTGGIDKHGIPYTIEKSRTKAVAKLVEFASPSAKAPGFISKFFRATGKGIKKGMNGIGRFFKNIGRRFKNLNRKQVISDGVYSSKTEDGIHYIYDEIKNEWVTIDEYENGLKDAYNAAKGGAKRAAQYASEWGNGSLKNTIERFAPGVKGVKTSTGKTLYKNSETGIQVVADDAGAYFRIENTNLTGKRRYLDIDGGLPNNKVIDGRTMGRSQGEYNQVTHFNNID